MMTTGLSNSILRPGQQRLLSAASTTDRAMPTATGSTLESTLFTGIFKKKAAATDSVNLSPLRQPNQKLLYNHVDALTKLDRSFRNKAGMKDAADYIRKVWEALGLNVTEQEFKTPYGPFKNVMVSFGPPNAERIVVGAHYDVCITEYPGGHKPGADDNASAVAGLLELARLLKQGEGNLKHRIDLVAFANEEPPFFRSEHMGSAVHAKSLKDAKVPVKGMISLDMIGYFSEDKGSQHYPPIMNWFYPSKGNFIGVVGEFKAFSLVRQIKKGIRNHANIDVRSICAPKSIPGIDFSDHQNYSKYGWPAVMVTDTAFYRNPNYHKVSDTIDTLNFEKMAEVVKGLHGVLTQ